MKTKIPQHIIESLNILPLTENQREIVIISLDQAYLYGFGDGLLKAKSIYNPDSVKEYLDNGGEPELLKQNELEDAETQARLMEDVAF